MAFLYLILGLIALRAGIWLLDIFTGRNLQHDHEWQNGYHMAQGTYNSITGKYRLRVIIEQEIDQGRFTKHWYGAACYLADTEQAPWPRPWGDHIYPKTWAKFGDVAMRFFNTIEWICENPVPATVVLAGGILAGAVWL